MKKMIITLIAFAFLGCSKSEDPESQFNLDVIMEFSVFNSEKQDLLDPETPGHFDESEITLFYVVDGKTIEVFNAGMDYPKNYIIYKHENEYRIAITLNDTKTSIEPVTYVKWNETDIDTIKTMYLRGDDYFMKYKVWFNGNLIWELGLDQEEYYKIMK